MEMTGPEGDQMTVLMCPDYRDSNPYQSKLITALDARGVDITAIPGNGAFPLLSGVSRHGVPDVVHIHWLHQFLITKRRFPAVLALLLGARLFLELALLRGLGVRLVWTVHNRFNHERTAPRTELMIRHGVARLVDRLIVHCGEAADVVREGYHLPDRAKSRVRVIPHGNFAGIYEDEVSRAAARERLGIPSDVPVLTFFGLIRPYKNVPRLIKTFERLRGDARLLVVGNPWNAEVEERVRAASAGDNRVETVLEYVSDDEIQIYLRAADAVVLPFDSVLTSGSAVLAMTFGRAVVAPSMGCLPELVGSEGGILYDPADPEGLHNALQEVISNRDRIRAMGQWSHREARRLDWDRIARRTRDVYDLEGIERVDAEKHTSADKT